MKREVGGGDYKAIEKWLTRLFIYQIEKLNRECQWNGDSEILAVMQSILKMPKICSGREFLRRIYSDFRNLSGKLRVRLTSLPTAIFCSFGLSIIMGKLNKNTSMNSFWRYPSKIIVSRGWSSHSIPFPFLLISKL